MSVKLLLGALFALIAPALAAADEDTCDQSTHLTVMECLNARIGVAAAELKVLYSATLAQRPDLDPSDIRKTRAQLLKSQEAWRNYVTAQCDLVGGLQGGSNSWVTTFAMQCVLEETKKRVDFLKHLPQGG